MRDATGWLSALVDAASFAELALACSAVLGALVAISLVAGFGAQAWLGPSRRIFALPLPSGQLRRETWGTLRFVLLAGVAIAATLRAVPHPADAPFWPTLLVAWLGFEVLYWGLHRALHTRALYRFHRYHHLSRVTTPMTGYSMSTVETLGWLVGLCAPLLALGVFVPVSIAGWLAYALYHVSGNVIGHSNAELLGRPVQGRWLSWISHPITYHALHHARVRDHYGFGSTFMDRLLKTEASDWRALHARVLAGKPLQDLAERG